MQWNFKLIQEQIERGKREYDEYLKHCAEMGVEALPYEHWLRKRNKEVWEKAFESTVLESGGMVVDLGHTKIGLLRKKNKFEGVH
jgi:hypothetical protein